MEWETPTVIEINMSAEIGAYQGEEDERPEELAENIGDGPQRLLGGS
jgi:hypothetical protein